MCGISAIISKIGTNTDEIVLMNNIIKHRGPDDEGFLTYELKKNILKNYSGMDTHPSSIKKYNLDSIKNINQNSNYNLIIGHRRLSIQDLTSLGHQPMTSICENYVVAYNGEIYNFEVLKTELIQKGYSFKSSTDTEVLLNGYIEWGNNLLNRLNGMFSFIIFNKKRNSVFIARDRFGVKPLYYYFKNNGDLYLASEIKQFTALNNWESILNNDRAYDYLCFAQTDHTNETMFEGVYQVPPGHYCEFKINNFSKKIEFKKWYFLKKKRFRGTLKEAAEKLRVLFKNAVEIRMKADVPIGTCLSGGIDSSSIACVVNNLISKKEFQKTFSSCSEHDLYDETYFIKEVLKNLKNAQPILFNLDHAQFKKKIQSLVYTHDEPFLSPSVFAQSCVYEKVIKSNVKVNLDGHGSDEQLCGYHDFFGPMLFYYFKKLRWIKLFKEIFYLKKLYNYNFLYSFNKILAGFLPKFLYNFLYRVMKAQTLNENLINLRLINKKTLKPKITNEKERSLEQIFRTKIPKQLKWCDRNSMSNSVESRIPFLDYRLVEFLFSIPVEFKICNGITKKVFRESMKTYLPKKIYNRVDKMGFVTPAELWVRNDPIFYKNLILSLQENSKNIFNKKAIVKFNLMIEGKISFDNSFWRALFFAEWMKVFKVQRHSK